jgi:hypothetical protein
MDYNVLGIGDDESFFAEGTHNWKNGLIVTFEFAASNSFIHL